MYPTPPGTRPWLPLAAAANFSRLLAEPLRARRRANVDQRYAVNSSGPLGTIWVGFGLGAFYLALIWINVLLGVFLTPLFLIPLTWLQDAVLGRRRGRTARGDGRVG